MDSKKPLYKSIPFWVMVLLLLYSALGFFAVPYFVKNKSKQIISEELNSTLILEGLSFNPFTFSSSSTGVKLTDKDSTLWFSADEISIDLNLWSSIFSNISIEEFSINNPYYKIVTENKNNEFSIAYPKLKTSSENTSTNTLIVDVNNILIAKGVIEYNDRSGEKQFNLNLKELTFNHQQFTTKDTDSQFDLSFKTQNNDESYLSGQFNFAQLKLNAKWKLKNWSTKTIFTFISNEEKKAYGLSNQSGLMNGNGTVVYQGLENQQSRINIEQLNLNAFKNTHDEGQHFDIEKTSLKNAIIDIQNQIITLEEVTTAGALVDLTFNKNNSLVWNIQQIAQQSDNNSPDPTQGSDRQKPWSVDLKQFINRNSIITLNKKFKENTLTNTLILDLVTIDNISLDESKTIELDAQMNLDKTGKISIQSTIIPDPLTVNSSIKIQNVDLSKFKAWIPTELKIDVSKGTLSMQQNLAITEDIESEGSMHIAELELVDKNKASFLAIKQLSVEKINLNSKNKTIKLNTIELNQAQGTLLLSADKQLNLSDLVETTPSNAKETTNKNDWKIEIDEIEIIDSKTSFIDNSIKPQYQTELAKLNGNIKGLSSSNISKAKVKLSGVIDSYGKISINGKINPLSDKAYTDLSITINNLDLQNFSAYSSQFLGFPINRGKADFNLKYKLNQSVLKGINDLTFKQLKFGNKTPSKEAIDLPLKLAVSLLTDGKGIMKINMPVSGNLNDPEFSYGGLVFKAFFKLIAGIVASPFKLLGKLIPGGADLDLSGVQFHPGSVQLQVGEEEKLNAMQQILSKKKDLILELTGIIHTDNDSKAIRLHKLLKQIQRDKAPDFSDEAQQKFIRKFYIEKNSDEDWQTLVNKHETENKNNSQYTHEMAWKELLKEQKVDNELSQLAKQRALFIQSQLIEKNSISEDRIYLKQGEESQELPPQVKFGITQ